MFKQISFSRVLNVLTAAFCVITLLLAVTHPRPASPKLSIEQLQKVEWLRESELVGVREGDFLTLQGQTYVVVDSNWRLRDDRSLVLAGPGPSSNQKAEEMKFCMDDAHEMFHLYKQLTHGQMIMQKDPYHLKRDANWEATASWYWLQ